MILLEQSAASCSSSIGFPIVEICIAIFLAILFLQSGLDKGFNYKSELSWITEHFSKSPLNKGIEIMFPVLTALEVLTGLVNVWDVFSMLNTNYAIACGGVVCIYGSFLSCVTLICLFFGQRMAKDYAGAASLVPYFILSVFGLYLSI